METPIGFVPSPEALDLSGLKDVPLQRLLEVNKNVWQAETERNLAFLRDTFKDDCPPALINQGNALLKRLQ